MFMFVLLGSRDLGCSCHLVVFVFIFVFLCSFACCSSDMSKLLSKLQSLKNFNTSICLVTKSLKGMVLLKTILWIMMTFLLKFIILWNPIMCLWTQFCHNRMLNWARNKRRAMNWTCILKIFGNQASLGGVNSSFWWENCSSLVQGMHSNWSQRKVFSSQTWFTLETCKSLHW